MTSPSAPRSAEPNLSRSVAGRVEELRRLFDASFALAPATSNKTSVDLLAIRAGDTPYAIRLREISGIFLDTTIEPVPSQHPQLLGMAAFRGAFLPVFDLRTILGQKLDEPPRWTLLVGAPTRLALAFDHFDGHLRIPDDAVASPQGPPAAAEHTREIVETGTGVLPVLHMPSVLATIERPTTTRTTKEH